MSDERTHDATLAWVLDRLETLEAENARLAAKLEELDASTRPQPQRRSQYRKDSGGGHSSSGFSRRGLLKRMAGAGAVGAGILAVGDTFAPRAAQAATGGNMILGEANDAGSFETSVTSTVGDEPAFRAIQTAPSGIGNIGSIALAGDTNGPYIAVAGMVNSNNSPYGTGVLGVQGAESGVSVPFGPGSSIAPPRGAVVGDTTTAHYAIAGTSSVGTAVYGCSFGSADVAGGVPIAAVIGDTNSANHPALMGRNSNGPQLQLVPSGIARPASGVSGDLIQDKNNILWLCLGGTLWRKLGGSTTAGQLHVLSSPVRVYDSRKTGGPLAAGQERTLSLTTGTNGTTPAVPAGATAALFTLTIVNTGSSGFLAAFSNAVSYPGTSNIDWFLTNSILATSVTSAVDSSAKIKVHCGGTKTDFVIDVAGYYQ